MELYQILTFITVAKERNLIKAAKKLHISQISVNSHIKALETELNIKLFIRNSSGMFITSEGKKLLNNANKIVESVNKFKQTALNINNTVEGNVNIGINPYTNLLLLNNLIETTKKNYPNVLFNFIQDTSDNLTQKILNNQIDFSFIFDTINNEKIETLKLKSFNLFIIGDKTLKNDFEKLNIKKSTEIPWILPPINCPLYRVISNILKKYNIKINNSIISDNEQTLKNLVRSGLGISIIPEWNNFIYNKDFSISKLDNLYIDLNLIYLKSNKNKLLNKNISEIFNIVWKIVK